MSRQDVVAFVERWANSQLREQQAAQSHFNELCRIVGHKTPTELDPKGEFFTFEEKVEKADGRRGRADVWYKGHFAWEYKGKLKDLDAAYTQLLSYKGDLDNPPLLVVCDFLEYRIYPQWTNIDAKPFVFRNEDLLNPKYLRYIEWLLREPEQFFEERQRELENRERLTRNLAQDFARLADLMRRYQRANQPAWTAAQIARFLTRILFLLFAEDIKLLPRIETKTVFRYILDSAVEDHASFVREMQTLFETLDGRHTTYMARYLPYFNGSFFATTPDEGERPEVLDITEIPGALAVLQSASDARWESVNPTIFGTMFEGALDPSKRAQLGAHYTSESDIRLVLEPVLMQPLMREWETVQQEAAPYLRTFVSADSTPREKETARGRLTRLYGQMMDRLQSTTVLDPACGSGNFLYMSLRLMKDLEEQVRKLFKPLELPFRDVVTPRQFYGIEKDEFAANLAHVVIWIGYLQWRYEHEGELHPKLPNKPPTPYDLPNPILKDKDSPDEPDRILCADAIMRYDERGKPYEPEWAAVDVMVGNPPFLGGNRIRQELGQYVDDLFKLYEGRVPAFADLVCYWFEKARAQLEAGKVQRCGLLATNSIRGGVNREVLKRIKRTGDIFMAWSDRDWVLNGAAVNVSIIGFDGGSETERVLDGKTTESIAADLTRDIDLTTVNVLQENTQLCFMGASPKAPFDIPAKVAQTMLSATNESGRSNSEVVRPVASAVDLVGRNRGEWTIDFGLMSLEEAKQFELPFSYVAHNVFPVRSKNRRASYAEKWWQYAEARPGLRKAIEGKRRFVVTPTLAKHRIFVWGDNRTLYNQQVITFAREDNYFFGVLHSYAHELWSLRQGTSLEDRPRYTPTTTFETFPLPFIPGYEDMQSPHYQAISVAAKQLNEEREAWLNPPDLIALNASEKLLRDRTLTNLYNAVTLYREGKLAPSRENPAIEFAPRLAELHDTLDRAVLAAYGWSDLADVLRTEEGDNELLSRLLALNLERSGG